MLSDDKLTEIYCMADDFCKFFDETVRKHSFQVSDGKRHRNKPNRMSNAEVITTIKYIRTKGCQTLLYRPAGIEVAKFS